MIDTAGALLVRKADAARLLSVSVRTVDRLISRGILPARRIGGAVRIPVAALQAIASEHAGHNFAQGSAPR